jgi:MarR family transcriptional regulator for hemolysin
VRSAALDKRSRLEGRFTAALGPLRQSLRRLFDAELMAFDLSSALAAPLVQIRGSDGIRQGELAARLDIEGPTLVRLLDQLEAMGLVARRPDADDQRAKTLHLTPAGEALTRRIMPVIDGLRARLLADVSSEELEGCLRVFDRLVAAIESRHA